MTSISLDEMHSLQKNIEAAFDNSELLQQERYQNSVITMLRYLEKGLVRVASPSDQDARCGQVAMGNDLETWQVHSWVKKSILLAMRFRSAQTFKVEVEAQQQGAQATQQRSSSAIFQGRVFAGNVYYHDKFDVQSDNLAQNMVRSVWGSIVREGAYVAPQAILMPSFVNIGAWVGSGTMIDTWATAGSCAQIGAHVHVAGGVGIGGVLEPANARPVLIGDHAFLGSRVIVVEGTVVGTGAVLGANVCLTASTPIYDVTTSEKKEYRGFVPANAVVAAGTRMKKFGDVDVPLQCAYIIAYRSEKTDKKISLNDILRETGIPI